jgi:hypothetical protein
MTISFPHLTLSLLMSLHSYEAIVIQSGAALSRLNAHIDIKAPSANCTVSSSFSAYYPTLP